MRPLNEEFFIDTIFVENPASDFQLVRIGLVSRIHNYIMNNNIFDIDLKSFFQRFNFTYFWSKIIKDSRDILRFQNGNVC